MKLTIIAHRSNTVDFDILPDASCTIYDQNGNTSSSLFLSKGDSYTLLLYHEAGSSKYEAQIINRMN